MSSLCDFKGAGPGEHRPEGALCASLAHDRSEEGDIQATTAEEVIQRLGAILDDSRREGSRLGYFPALYRKVTIHIQKSIGDGEFEDSQRMEKLEVVFANRYLEAYDNYRVGKPTTQSWRLALETASRWWPIVLQHLFLGMNAHINLDLGIAAARTCPGDSLEALKNDFEKINQILASLVSDVERGLEKVWPMLRLLDRTAGRTDETIINFSMAKAREHAWGVAERLAPLDIADQTPEIELIDAETTLIGQAIRNPGFLISAELRAIRLGERRSVSQIIDILS